MTRRSRVMSLWNYFDLPSHELWYFISQKPLFQKFHFKNNSIWWTMQQILRNDFEKWFWEMIYHGTSPMIYHFSKSFLKIWLFMFCLHSLAMAGWPIHSRTADTATVLSISQPAPIHREYEKNISRKFIYILLILKWFFTSGGS